MAARAGAYRTAVEREPPAVERALQAVADDLPSAQQRAGVGTAQAQGVDAPAGAAEDGRQSFDRADLPIEKLAVRADADQPPVAATAPAEDLDDAQHDGWIVSHFREAFQGRASHVSQISNPIRYQLGASVAASPAGRLISVRRNGA